MRNAATAAAEDGEGAAAPAGGGISGFLQRRRGWQRAERRRW